MALSEVPVARSSIRSGSQGRVAGPVIAAVIPCYRVRQHILPLLDRIGPEVEHIVVVDDACPERSGQAVLDLCQDPRVIVLTHAANQGVGGAMVTGYAHALSIGVDIIVKLDGDGQMDPALIGDFIRPIAEKQADYVKGNRFYNVEDLAGMPRVRLLGNAALSLMTKFSSGYWTMFDPTNGYTAVSAKVLAYINLRKLSPRYFFETDMLFRLNTVQAVVVEQPMPSVYGEEVSNLKVRAVLLDFLFGNARNFGKRIFYNFVLRGFSAATLELLVGLALLGFGLAFGVWGWGESIATGRPATTGTVMLAALPIILGVQFLLSFLAFDIAATPTRPMSAVLPSRGPEQPPPYPLLSVARCGAPDPLRDAAYTDKGPISPVPSPC